LAGIRRHRLCLFMATKGTGDGGLQIYLE